jgi:hypothetical protein
MKEERSLKRDLFTTAIIDTDSSKYEQYMQRQKQILAEKKSNEERINKIEKDMSDIKGMLLELLSKAK